MQEHVVLEPQGREPVHGADPAHHLRDRTDGRLRHPLHQLRSVRWRHRPRLQPDEFPLGQCRHIPDFARLAHVAGGEQVLQGRPADPDHACASGCRRPARCSRAPGSTTRSCRWAATRSASPAPCRARRSGMVKCRTVDAYTLADAEIVLEGYVHPRDRRYETEQSEEAGVQGRFHFHPEWAGYMGKAYKAPTFHVTAVTMRQAGAKPIIFCARRAHARRPQHRHHRARGGDLRTVRAVAARHRPGRGDSLLA